jgi:methyl-accepting chemotaxis protein
MRKAYLKTKWSITVPSSWRAIIFYAVTATVGVIFFYCYTSSLIEKRTIRELELRISLIKDLIKGAYQDVQAKNQDLIRFFKADLGNITLDENSTIDVNGVQTPLLKSDDHILNLNSEIIDEFYQRTATLASIFIKKDTIFVRIATTLKTETGQRALGTIIGPDYPGYDDLLHGKVFIGQVELMGSQYIVYYDPLTDSNGRLIGILGIGTDFTISYQSLKEKIRSIRIGETGNAFVLAANPGSGYGNLIIHPQQEGKNILDAKDKSGRLYIKDILEQKNGHMRYFEEDKSAKKRIYNKKLAVFTFYPEWQSVIVVTVQYDEVTHGSLFIIAGIMAFITLVSGLAIWFKNIG